MHCMYDNVFPSPNLLNKCGLEVTQLSYLNIVNKVELYSGLIKKIVDVVQILFRFSGSTGRSMLMRYVLYT
jgi:hypothetical protein